MKLTENISVKILNIYYDNFFDFSILNFNLRNILINPIKAKIEINDSMKEIDIISDNQVNYIVKENKVIAPYSFCKKCKVRNGLIFYNLMRHSSCDDFIDIRPFTHFSILNNKEEFNNFFPKSVTNEFNSPKDFDINFHQYFKKNNYINSKKKFIYYDDIKSRKEILGFLNNSNSFGKYLIFFGVQGIGKSITIIHTLKYEIDHNTIKTLYIHCKYLGMLNEGYNNIEIKRILLSEIPYLFYNDFSSYEECVEIIKNFEFSYGKTFINMIEKILEYILKKMENTLLFLTSIVFQK